MTAATLFRRLAWATAWAAAALVILGGVVRITGSGMGCGPDWPLCNGRVIPDLSDPKTVLEYAHRLAAAASSLLFVALAAVAWTRHRHSPRLRNPATLATALLLLQAILGAVAVKLETAALSVIVHFGNAMAILAVLVVAAERAAEAAPPPGRAPDGFARLAWAAATVGGAVVLLGALVANLDAGFVCRGFPLCNGRWLPASDLLIQVHWGHRMLAYGFAALAVGLALAAQRHRSADAVARRAASWVLILVALQVSVAAAMVLDNLPTSFRAAHLAVGTVVWIALVRLVHCARRGVAALESESRILMVEGLPTDR